MELQQVQQQEQKTPVSVKEIAWLAGLLEGEGCFRISGKASPTIHLNMTDKDVVEHVATLLGVKHVGAKAPGYRSGRQHNRTMYTVTIHGSRAAAWMMTLFTLLGTRRQTKIREVLSAWRSGFSWNTLCRRGLHRLTGDNILQRRGDRRRCRACYEARQAQRAA